jgi:hypothetical protein
MNCCEAGGRKEGTCIIKEVDRDMEHFGSRDVDELLLKELNSVACSPSELYLLSDRRLSAKLVPTFADRGCRVVSATNLYGR